MEQFDAVMIAEGVMPPPGTTDDERAAAYLAAWQQLINTGVAWTLQGWFGRTAAALIEAGHCTAPGEVTDA